MTEFLYTKPPAELKFFPCGSDLFYARGAVVVFEKEKGQLPDLLFFRFNFQLHCKNRIIDKASFVLEMLCNLHTSAFGTSPSWDEEAQAALAFEENELKEEGKIYVRDHYAALNYWQNEVDKTFEGMKTENELKLGFAQAMSHVYVVRHYFEADWIIMDGDEPVKIDFRNVYHES